MKKTFILNTILLCFVLLPIFFHSVFAQYQESTNHDMLDSNNWNLRIIGKGGNERLFGSTYQNFFKDVDGNGINDLIICSPYEDNSGRIDSGSCYLIYDSILSSYAGVGKTLDLADSSNYNVRFDGPTVGATLGYSVGASFADLNNNGRADILLSTPNAHILRPGAGSFFIIFDNLLDRYSGTGNVVDLAKPENFSVRYDGSSSVDNKNYISESFLIGKDINNNGMDDIIVGSGHTGLEGRSRSGSMYLIYDSLINSYSGTGNTVDLEQSSNYNLVFYNAQGSYFSLLGDIAIKDLNHNNKNDIVVGAGWADNNLRQNSGSLYLIYDHLINSYTGTGNRIDLTVPNNYNVRFDGAASSDLLSYNSVLAKDFNGNGNLDLIIGSLGSGQNQRQGSGSVYLVYDSIIDNLEGTGNIIDLADINNFSYRFDGAYPGSSAGFGIGEMFDYDKDGKLDIIIPASGESNNERQSSGSVYVINNQKLSQDPQNGNIYDLLEQENFSIRYDGAEAGDSFGFSVNSADFNYDGVTDLVVTSAFADPLGRIDAGAVYLIYNFPHSITIEEQKGAAKYKVKGIADAPNSVTKVAGVQSSLDSDDFHSNWTDCIADDGVFDSKTESFSCEVKNISQGEHWLFIRAYDDNMTYTPIIDYANITFGFGQK